MNIFEWLNGALNWKSLQEEIEKLNDKVVTLKNDIEQKNEEIEALKALIKTESVNGAKKLGTISYSELKSLLSPYCKEIYLSDNNYSLTSVGEAKKYSQRTKVSINKWQKEEYDCDEFSFALMGYWNLDLYQFAFGIAWSKTHAFNIMVDNNKKVYVIEPQSNKFIPIETAMKNSLYYPFKIVMI